ncbi:MAG: Hsp20/alpha crystallin family protein [Candidatus Thiodiazotropha sp. (ex Cardiolucina cf. quadrata)]|nr:Hsp20/alpha crystallin family protein [Candidatus Thiodiazotropha sp. (ex Cardiolucina cf. quadrata)]
MFARLHGFEGGLLNEFRRMEHEMDKLFSAGVWPNTIRTVARDSYPPINIGTTSTQVDLYLFVAGVDPESLDISIHDSQLTVDGERQKRKDNKASYFRNERYDGAFHKVVNLPDDVDADKVEASYRNGVLHIVVQRRESSKPRQITVQ